MTLDQCLTRSRIVCSTRRRNCPARGQRTAAELLRLGATWTARLRIFSESDCSRVSGYCSQCGKLRRRSCSSWPSCAAARGRGCRPGDGRSGVRGAHGADQPRWLIAESCSWRSPPGGPCARCWWAGRGAAHLSALTATQMVRVGRRWPGVPRSTSFEQLLTPPDTEQGESAAMAADEPPSCVTSGTTEAPRPSHTRAHRSLPA